MLWVLLNSLVAALVQHFDCGRYVRDLAQLWQLRSRSGTSRSVKLVCLGGNHWHLVVAALALCTALTILRCRHILVYGIAQRVLSMWIICRKIPTLASWWCAVRVAKRVRIVVIRCRIPPAAHSQLLLWLTLRYRSSGTVLVSIRALKIMWWKVKQSIAVWLLL